MSVRRVAIIFDDTARPETTGVYCRRALESLVAVEHFRPADLERIPRQGFDLYLNIDDGLRYVLPEGLRPSAWWAIDTHMDFDWCLTKSHHFDFLFAAQRDGAEQLRDGGISTTWLPLACDPEVHKKQDVVKTFDVCFVGNIFPGERADLVGLLRSRFRNTFVGRCYFDEMARTYSASRVVFNRSIRNDVNMRVFEAVACGSLLLTNDLRDNGQEELFRDGVHLATYRDADELVDKVRFYLDREAVRERIAAAGRAEALARHTYRHRMESLLAEVEKNLSLRGVPSGPSEEANTKGMEQKKADAPATAGNGSPQPPGASAVKADLSYFEFARPELLALVPRSARKVLEIGCGAGRLGEALKARQPAEVVGIEVVEAAAQVARERLDQVFAGDVEAMELPFAPASFDAVVCGDVLEHLRRPEELLRRVRGWLRPSGRLIASIPNVRHHTVVRSLLDGNWTYEPAGLLDRTHLHFFTRRDIEDLLRDTGFTVARLDVVPGPGDEEWWERGPRREVKAGRLQVANLPPDEVQEFYVYQYLVTAEAASGDEAVRGAGMRLVATTAGPAPERRKRRPARAADREPEGRHPKAGRTLRIMYLGDFGSSWRHEALVANALLEQGHAVSRFHEYLMPSVNHVVAELNSGRYDCLLFYKGRIAARTTEEVFSPTGETIAAVIERARVPCYAWYVDRAYQFDYQPSREVWMRRVAPLCRVVFVADGALARTDWARWHVLREPIDPRFVQHLHVPDARRKPLAFIGQLYGDRDQELVAVAGAFPLEFITGTYGAALSPAIQGFKIILGPRYPTVPGFWGNRVYVVLGHGGFFLAPEVEGMREEGIVAGKHYAPLGDDAVADVRAWLARPAERERIARTGQELVLRRFTYERAVRKLCRVIEETL
jgi:2-polyprenyl-3-methyl-5-hydroxy-6-metoxy-1,4-benzoquinol methylase